MVKDLWDFEKEFEKLQRQMDMLQSNFFMSPYSRLPQLESNYKSDQVDFSFKIPAADIYETEKEVVAKIEVPGIKKEDVKLEIKNNTLYLKAEHKNQKEDKDEKKGFHRIERTYKGFQRVFTLPSEVDETKIKATCKEGILEVHMQKKEKKLQDKKKYIEIN